MQAFFPVVSRAAAGILIGALASINAGELVAPGCGPVAGPRDVSRILEACVPVYMLIPTSTRSRTAATVAAIGSGRHNQFQKMA